MERKGLLAWTELILQLHFKLQASLRVKVQAYLIELFSILTDITSRYRSHFGRSLFSMWKIGTSKMRVISEVDISFDYRQTDVT